jgi:hypothetical protein
VRIGVTGTREGATDQQLTRVINYMIGLGPGNLHELHHGDCAGVDSQVACAARHLGWRLVCHPPISDYLRAYEPSDETREPLDYLERDRNIVDETELLIVVPLHNPIQKKGGTWYTYLYASKRKKKMQVFLPEYPK